MVDKAASDEKKMPKGGRKGGTRFPRYSLGDCLDWAKKLVSKTHFSAQPKDVILSGVVDAKGSTGEIRISALKQYALLDGDSKGYSASELAKSINSAPKDERAPLHKTAFLNATVFKALFDTFHGDTVPKARLKQRASSLKVHPDETDACVEVYVAGLITSGLGSVQGDNVSHLSSLDAVDQRQEVAAEATEEISDDSNNGALGAQDLGAGEPDLPPSRGAARATIQVNVTLDSSLDTDKLERQLKLLKRYGAL